jgi:hypothetical protein
MTGATTPFRASRAAEVDGGAGRLTVDDIVNEQIARKLA